MSFDPGFAPAFHVAPLSLTGVTITVTNVNADGMLTDVQITGLTPGTRYDVLRRAYRWTGDDDTDTPQYELWLPDRDANWSAVAHRVGWEAPGSGTMTFRDYEPDLGPFAYFIVPSASVGPPEWDFTDGDYPLERGELDDTIVDINRELTEAPPATVIVRSTAEIGKWVETCLYDIQELRYQARGTEMGVIGNPYPLYVADRREARRGQVVFSCTTLGTYNLLREIVWPASGKIAPVVLDTIGPTPLLVDAMTCIPLDVSVEQATQRDPDLRFITMDFVEVRRTTAQALRSGDNDTLVDVPHASFTMSDTTPAVGQWVTLTDTSTGQYDSWEWSWSHGSSNRMAHSRVEGPIKVRWLTRGAKTIKLRVYGSVAGPKGADVAVRHFTVHG